MFTRTRKVQPIESSGATSEINDSTYTGSNGSINHNGHTSHLNRTIPANKAGKKYDMNQVFDVWYENKDLILNTNQSLPIQHGEHYKLSKPKQIYHLDLQINDPAANKSKNSSSHTSSPTKILDVDRGNGNSDQCVRPNDPCLPDNTLDNLIHSLQDLKLTSNQSLFVDHQPSSNSIENNQPQNHANGPRVVPPPGMLNKDSPTGSNAGLSSSLPATITSDKIQWIYIDPSGNEQGPFNGDMMQEWLTEGYLSFDLKIRRQEEYTYQTLKEFCTRVLNFQQPFKIPLLDLSEKLVQDFNLQPPQLQQSQFSQHQQSQQVHNHLNHQNYGNGSSAMSSGGSDLLFTQPLANQSLHQQLSTLSLSNPTLSGQQGPSQLSQFHQFVSNVPGNLGSTNMRLNNSLNNPNTLFGNDFISSDPFAPNNSLSQQNSGTFGVNQFGIDPMTHHSGIGGFNNLQHHINPMPSILQHQIQSHHQQPGLSRNGSSWSTSLDNTNTLLGSNPGTPGPVQQPLAQQPLAQQPNQPAPISPWTTGIQSQSRVSSPFVSTNGSNTNVNDSNGNKDVGNDSVLDDLHSVVTDILGDADDQQIKKTTKQTKQAKKPLSIPENLIPESSKPSQQDTGSISENKKPALSVKRQSRQSSTVSDIAIETQDLKPSTPTSNKLAPWAVPKVEAEKPVLSLKEIQKMDADRLEKQKQLESQARAEQAAKMWAVESSPTIENVELPKATSWATSSTQIVTPTKTLAEIQKEEAEAAAAKLKAAKLGAAAGSIPALKSTFASTLANSVPKDNSWVTVASKKQPTVKKQSSTPSSTIPIGAKASPQILRSVSATRTTTSSINANAIREEFIIWARSAMTNLYPSVSKDDLLDMFITLPANSADSSSLISETIYSSSATMDGRRYAQEFMKKRQAVDKQLGASSDIDWSSAIVSSADKSTSVDEDGWSTSSKSKKRGKKF